MEGVSPRKTVADRVAEHGEAARRRWLPRFQAVGVAYPPRKLTLVGLKQERVLEVWAADSNDAWVQVARYPILGASGQLGPKLAEGDRQVPEGLYRIESLNPNSRFHLSLRVNYPNAFDREKGALDGRSSLGSDIMIHGGIASIGCLAMGDPAAEDLFVLAAECGLQNLSLILTPVDFRVTELPTGAVVGPAWVPELYAVIREALRKLRPAASAVGSTGSR